MFHNISNIFKKTHIVIICFFIFLNFVIGLLFHKSLNVTCISEFFILALYGIFFWIAVSKLLHKLLSKWSFLKSSKYLWIHGGISFSASLLNIVIGQSLIIFCTIYIYRCESSPSFDFLNALLTNNLAVNLTCYFALTFYFIYQNPKNATVPSATKQAPVLENVLPHTIKIQTNGKSVYLELSRIKFIETSNNCIIIHTSNKKYVKYQSLKRFMEEQAHPSLKRVHRSYVINVNFIDSVQKNKNGDGSIVLQGGEVIKLSRNYSIKF